MKKKSSTTYDGEKQQLDRKTIEKNRRIHMKSLCFKLTSLIPSHHFHPSKEQLSQLDQLDQVATYIKHLQEQVEGLKEKKQVAIALISNDVYEHGGSIRPLRPVVDITEIDSALQVTLISGLKKNFMLYEAITIIEEEGGQVITARYSIIGNKIFHTLHAQAKVSRVGVETSRVYERLQELIC